MKFIRILGALAVGAFFGVIQWNRPWHRLLGLWYLLKGTFLTYGDGAWASPEKVEKRMAVCRQCPMFYEPLQTCGSPLKGIRGGCWCSCEAKTIFEQADCWLADSEEGRDLASVAQPLFKTQLGWPDGL